MIRRACLTALTLLWARAAVAVECRDQTFEGIPFTACEVDARAEPLSLFLDDDAGRPFGSFAAVERQRGPLAFAMNAGMYHEDRSPVGLHIEDGRELSPLVTADGSGNFGLLPNGLLCLTEEGAFVVEARAFAARPLACRSATQSGPMLVIDGALHPRFLPDSDSRHWRNGVGTSKDGRRAAFVISGRPVTFHEFARLFRDGLGLPDALYLDGSVSRLHAPSLGRSDFGARMGPIVGLLAADALPSDAAP